MLISCPSCQRHLRVPDEAAGKQVKCPSCQQVFTAGSTTTGEEIQAPPAPRPSAPTPPPGAIEEETQSRRADGDADDGNIDLRDDGYTRRLANIAAAWFFAAAIVSLLVAAVNIVMTVALGGFEDNLFDLGGGDEEAMIAGMICGFGCCGSLILAVVVTMIVAGLHMKSMNNKAWVVTGIVEALGLALFFGGGTLLNAFYMLVDAADAMDHWVPVTILLGIVAAVLNCIAGVKAILTLNNPAVSAEFERNRSRRRRQIRWED